MKKYLIRGVIVLQILLVVSLGRSLFETMQSRKRVQQLIDKKERLLEEQVELEAEAEKVGSEYYLEKIAREKLHLTKPGETVVLVGEGVVPDILGVEDGGENEKSVFRKWIEVLFGKD